MFILTEKPSVSESFAQALGGFTKYGGYWSNRKGDCITNAQGHLLGLKMPEDYDEELGKWSLDQLPIIPPQMEYKVLDKGVKQYKVVKECFRKFDTSEFILATDADREGELIGRLILSAVGFKNWSTAKRFWVSEALEKDVVLEGLKDAKPLKEKEYEHLYEMGRARQHADWFTGLNITRLLTCSVHKKLTFGRVQTAVLRAVCTRDEEIANFKPVPYFQLYCKVVSEGKAFPMLYVDRDGKSRFDSKDGLQQVLSVFNSGDSVTVTDVKETEKSEEPPLLFDITELQKFCSNVFGYDPKQTLDAAQVLYDEKKCLSYPRTASQYMGNDNVKLIEEKYKLLSEQYPRQSAGCSLDAVMNVSKRIFNSAKVEGHHALIPLAPLPPGCSDVLTNVYNAVLLRFFQTLKKPYRYMAVEVQAEKDGHNLEAKGRKVLEEGWKAGFSEEEKDDDGEKESVLPDVKKGDSLLIDGTEIVQKETKPKKAFTNATLLSFMKNPKNEDGESKKLVGLGTSATRAGIIDELINNGYLVKSGKKIVSTDFGRFLIKTVMSIPALESFIRVDNTTRWESLLEESPQEFLSGIKDFVKQNVKGKINAEWKQERETLGDCPLCRDGKILEGTKGFYCSRYKEGCKFTVWKLVAGAKVSANDVKLLIAGKKTAYKKMKSKAGKEFQAALMLEGSDVKFVFKEPAKKKS